MKHSVEFETQAINDLDALDQTVRDRILKEINWLSKRMSEKLETTLDA